MIKRVGVIGAGQMGNGIAHVFAISGFDVRLSDISEERVENGISTIRKNMERQVVRNKLSEGEKDKALNHIKGQVGYEKFSDCDFVIEAATEDETLKHAIFKDLVPHLPPATMIASNTSSISITRLAASTDRPDRFMGVHFMNPVPLMQLVELIRGIATSEATFTEIKDLMSKLGKQIAISEDFPGFIVNRILMPMINEAVWTLHESVGTVEAIDKGMRLGTNHPMGPLELADLIGLDTCASIMNVLYQGLGGVKYKPCPLLIKYVEAGWLGRKTDRGFYDYSGDMPLPTR
ncbi:3-hydroxybutyryl-CoA dehydrogenase [Candidatus Bealeia paramacronuclearis]|uniref:3-hydroxybutyryl-CoA dehydrogenase n=1 Tax=Candidatus Bealeia paramacronuclearis TaxID=1921001 RepID=A0ABZ2C435_9PROT|nr:3-hydroxybutyryl-CoA dehydrogenase [Candidatus Bealeia paramacronuclearis]